MMDNESPKDRLAVNEIVLPAAYDKSALENPAVAAILKGLGLGPFQSAFVAGVRQKRSERQKLFFEDIASRYRDLRETVLQNSERLESIAEHVRSSEFNDWAAVAFEEYIRSPDEEKRSTIASFLANCAVTPDLDSAIQAEYWRLTRELVSPHYLLLRLLSKRQGVKSPSALLGLARYPRGGGGYRFEELAKDAGSSHPTALHFVSRLQAEGLVVRVSDEGDTVLGGVSGWVVLTPVGASYIGFLTAAGSAVKV